MRQYTIVPAPAGIAGRGATAQEAASAFLQIINEQQGLGWTYHSMETVAAVDAGNKRARLPGATGTTQAHLLVFYRDV